MSNRLASAAATSPTLVNAVTTLIVAVAVFLAYNANTGLPFVPVYRVAVDVPNAARLTTGNEVRIGGHRVGVVEGIQTTARPRPTVAAKPAAALPAPAARLELKLERSASPIPEDSVFRVRYLSTFGLKYVEIVRGTGPPAPEGFAFDGTDDRGVCALPVNLDRFGTGAPASARNGCFTVQTELDDLTNVFDNRTRADLRTVLAELGDALAGRGVSVADAIASTPPLLRDLRPVLSVLADRGTRLERLIDAAARTAEVVTPVADQAAELATNARVALAALGRDPAALRDSISGAVPLLERSVELLPAQRRLLADMAELARRLEPGTRRLPWTLPELNAALRIGAPVLERTPAAAADLRQVLVELRRVIDQPQTLISLERLRDTVRDAFPLAAHVAPAQTVCNYPTYLFTFLSEHLSLRSTIGFTQRNTVAVPYPPDPGRVSIGGVPFDFPAAARSSITGYSGITADGLAGDLNPAEDGLFKPHELPIGHGPVNAPTGQWTEEFPDCSVGQFGYPLGALRLPGQPREIPGIGVGDYPGSRGPTTLFYKRDGTRVLRDTRVPSRSPRTWGLGEPAPVPEGLTR